MQVLRAPADISIRKAVKVEDAGRQQTRASKPALGKCPTYFCSK
jgi:hypothetical protein